jgi:opacity protein-like surface antigen
MRLNRLSTLVAALGILFAVKPVAADTIVTGSIGRAFSGDLQDGHLSYGAAIGFMGEGVVGFEVEGTYTPDAAGDFLGQPSAGSDNVTTLMGNLILGVPVGGDQARIYATGGVGLLKVRVKDADEFFDVDRNDFGVNVGAGVMVRLGDRLGARGDVRYFRDVRESESGDFDVDLGGFHYWRAAVGLTLKF